MLVSRIKSLLPRPIRKSLGYARRLSEAPFFYLRGKKILHDYSRHFRKARQIFHREGNRIAPDIISLRDVGIRVVSFGEKNNLITLPENYLDLVDRVAKNARTLLDCSKECAFFPGLPSVPLPDRTEDIPAVKNGEVLTIQLNEPSSIEGLEDLCAPIMEELEQKVYGSYVAVDKVYVYRSIVSRQITQASWLWHYDNHPHEVLKVMIYLTDVTDVSSPFEYLRCATTLQAVPGSPLVPLYGDSRIPESAMTRYLAAGLERHKITGPRGTMILFDNNMIHRANVASRFQRDALIFQVRPVAAKLRPYIDNQRTGSFQHAPFNLNPNHANSSLQRPRHFAG